MDVWVAKVICLVLIMLLTLVFGLLPIRVVGYLRIREEDDWVYRRRHRTGSASRARAILSYLNCLSGGVFLSVCLLHLFPEVIDKYNVVMEKIESKIDFPIAELIVSGGFFLIMLIEHGVMSLNVGHLPGHGHSHGKEPGESRGHDGDIDVFHGSHDHGHGIGPSNNHGNSHGHGREPGQSSMSNQMPEHAAGQMRRHHSNASSSDLEEASLILKQNNQYGYGSTADTGANLMVEEVPCTDPLFDTYASYHHCEQQAPHHHHPGQTHAQTVQIHSIRSFVLLLALSMHTLFEGLALGLEVTTGDVWSLFAALAIHKSVIAFTMGIQFADTFQQTSRVLCYMVSFSIVAPIGIAIGTTITVVEQGSFSLDVSSMVLQGLATGTFLYVTFFEVLQKELAVGEHSVTKVLAIIVGFVAISLTNLLGG